MTDKRKTKQVVKFMQDLYDRDVEFHRGQGLSNIGKLTQFALIAGAWVEHLPCDGTEDCGHCHIQQGFDKLVDALAGDDDG